MKKTILALCALSFTHSLFATPSLQECRVREKVTEDNYNSKVQIAKEGRTTTVEVNIALLKWRRVQLKCASIVRGSATEPKSYCAQANRDAMKDLLAGLEERLRAGESEDGDKTLSKARIDEAEMKLVCDP